MTISERIFELLAEQGMSQKEFSERTGIAQSSISDWKRKGTNPVAEKILPICEVLGVTPDELLSGVEGAGERSHSDYYHIEKNTEIGILVTSYQSMKPSTRARLMGYMEALAKLQGR